MKKIKWLNVLKSLLFIISVSVIFWLIFRMVTSETYIGLSWFGLFLLLISSTTAGAIYLDFEEQTEMVSSTRTTQHHNKRYN